MQVCTISSYNINLIIIIIVRWSFICYYIASFNDVHTWLQLSPSITLLYYYHHYHHNYYNRNDYYYLSLSFPLILLGQGASTTKEDLRGMTPGLVCCASGRYDYDDDDDDDDDSDDDDVRDDNNDDNDSVMMMMMMIIFFIGWSHFVQSLFTELIFWSYCSSHLKVCLLYWWR